MTFPLLDTGPATKPEDLAILVTGFETVLSELWTHCGSSPEPQAQCPHPPKDPQLRAQWETHEQLKARAAAGCPMARMSLKPDETDTAPTGTSSGEPLTSDQIDQLVSTLKNTGKHTVARTIENAVAVINDFKKPTSPRVVPDGTVPKVGAIVDTHDATSPLMPTAPPKFVPDGTVPKVGAIVNLQDCVSSVPPNVCPNAASGLCPMSTKQPPKGTSITGSVARSLDPIQLELLSDAGTQGEKGGGTIGGQSTVPAACPIRFLEFHSPDDLAEYFGKHKHEIPRSHQVCVNRYQKNWNGQLDATYGNDISQVVKRLGEKHQPLLPPKDDALNDAWAPERMPADHSERLKTVEQWNEAVEPLPEGMENPESGHQKPRADGSQPEPDRGREQFFDRPMRHIRVGESPSRPWGIPVPPGSTMPTSTPARPAAHSTGPDNAVIRPLHLHGPEEAEGPFHLPPRPVVARKNFPFAPSPQDKVEDSPVALPLEALSGYGEGKIIFNGPVFIGYSADQARAILSQTNQAQGQRHRSPDKPEKNARKENV